MHLVLIKKRLEPAEIEIEKHRLWLQMHCVCKWNTAIVAELCTLILWIANMKLHIFYNLEIEYHVSHVWERSALYFFNWTILVMTPDLGWRIRCAPWTKRLVRNPKTMHSSTWKSTQKIIIIIHWIAASQEDDRCARSLSQLSRFLEHYFVKSDFWRTIGLSDQRTFRRSD
jgi:hypothetical protein